MRSLLVVSIALLLLATLAGARKQRFLTYRNDLWSLSDHGQEIVGESHRGCGC